MRLGQVLVELDRPPHVIHRGGQRPCLRLVARPGGLVAPEERVGEADFRERVARVERERALEIGDRRVHLAHVERLELHASLGERLVGLEARCLAHADPTRAGGAGHQAEPGGELGDDLVLEVEDVRQQAVGLRVGERLARLDVHDPRRDAEAVARPLKAARHGQVGQPLLPERGERSAGGAQGLGHHQPIDHPEPAELAQVVGDRLGDARGQPRVVGVAREVDEVGDGNDAHGARAARADTRCGVWAHGRQRVDRRDEAVAAAGDGLDVGGRGGIVAERLAQFRHGLRERVVGHGHVGPERREQLLLGGQRGRARDEVVEQVGDLGRERHGGAGLVQTERHRVEHEWTEAVTG